MADIRTMAIADTNEEPAPSSKWLGSYRESKNLLIAVVTIALFLDFVLVTAIVPIMPQHLYSIEHPDEPLEEVFKKTAPNLTTTSAAFLNTDNQGNATTTNSTWHEDLLHETIVIGLLLSIKPFVQLIANPLVGPLTHKIGYPIPMFSGLVILLISTIVFAFGYNAVVLFTARALQGIGSSLSTISGMSMLAECFPDEKERGTAMSYALGGLAVGLLVGPPYGGVTYQFIGYAAPFLILAVLVVIDGLMLLLVLPPVIRSPQIEAPSLKALLTDPYIIITTASITIANAGLAVLEPTLPMRVMDTMGASIWQQGIIFLPGTMAYLFGTSIFGRLGHRIGRWLVALLGLILIGISLAAIPFGKSLVHLILPNAGVGFAVGMVDSSLMPELGHLVDIRHSSFYGNIYAIGDLAFALSYSLGPALCGTLMDSIGFEWMLFGIAILNVVYAPVLFVLKNPPTKEENKPLVQEQNTRVHYNGICNKTTEE